MVVVVSMREIGDKSIRTRTPEPARADPEINRSYGWRHAAKSERQSGGWRPFCTVLHSWPPAQRQLILPDRMQYCDWCRTRADDGREIHRLCVSRRQLLETIEPPAMQALPEQDYGVQRVVWSPSRPPGRDRQSEVAYILDADIRSFLETASYYPPGTGGLSGYDLNSAPFCFPPLVLVPAGKSGVSLAGLLFRSHPRLLDPGV